MIKKNSENKNSNKHQVRQCFRTKDCFTGDNFNSDLQRYLMTKYQDRTFQMAIGNNTSSVWSWFGGRTSGRSITCLYCTLMAPRYFVDLYLKEFLHCMGNSRAIRANCSKVAFGIFLHFVETFRETPSGWSTFQAEAKGSITVIVKKQKPLSAMTFTS